MGGPFSSMVAPVRISNLPQQKPEIFCGSATALLQAHSDWHCSVA
jgi:hypothetical protein